MFLKSKKVLPSKSIIFLSLSAAKAVPLLSIKETVDWDAAANMTQQKGTSPDRQAQGPTGNTVGPWQFI